MAKSTSVIVLEFNELTPALVQRFMDAGELPHFQRFHSESEVYVTDAQETGDRLNPWIQWVTAHSGLSLDEHQVFQLDEASHVSEKAIWEILSDAGLRVWICGSMNSWYHGPLNGYLLPDPWSTATPPYPEHEFDDFYSFVRKQVQEHTNPNASVSAKDAIRFLRFLIRRGISITSCWQILKQLVNERVEDCHWKRAAIMDILQWDVFRWYYRRFQPHFSTFFLNSTAHYQHRFWRHMDPSCFQVLPDEQERRRFSNSILYGHQRMDQLLARFMDLAGEDTTLILMTGLGQQPYLDSEEAGGRRYYRPRDLRHLIQQLGIGSEWTFEPVMAEEFYLRFKDEDATSQAVDQLLGVKVGEEVVFKVDRRDCDSLLTGCKVHRAVGPNEALYDRDGKHLGRFNDLFYQIDAVKSGKHHPDGMLWVRRPLRKHVVHSEKLPLRAVAPMILDMFGVERPGYMQATGPQGTDKYSQQEALT